MPINKKFITFNEIFNKENTINQNKLFQIYCYEKINILTEGI